MNIGTTDLSVLFGLRAHQARIKSDTMTATQEVVTGQKQDLTREAGSLFAIDLRLERFAGEAETLRWASEKSNMTQISLNAIGDRLSGFGAGLLSALGSGDIKSQAIYAQDAWNKLDSTISALNTKYATHHVFSGASTDQPSLAPTSQLVSDISNLITGAPDIPTALTAIDAYFSTPGGGFETNIYQGSNIDAPKAITADGATIQHSVRADDPAIREALRSLAISAAVHETPGLSDADKEALLTESAESSIQAHGGVVRLQEQVGFAEQAIASARTHNATMTATFQIERNNIAQVDPFEAATRVQALQTQMQSIYTLTARISNLSLTNFLR